MAKAFDIDTAGTLATGLSAWYNFEGSSADEVGSRNGSDTSITYSSGNGVILEGAGFAGSSRIDLSSFTWGTVGSISFFFKASALADVQLLDGDAANAGPNVQIFGNKLYFGTNDANFCNDAASLSTGVWYHVVIIWDSIGLKLYKNTVNVATGGSSLPSTSGLKIGQSHGNANGFSGAFDLLGVWSKVLSTQEISDLYNSGAGNAYRTQSTTYTKSLSVSPTATSSISKSRTTLKAITATAASAVALAKSAIHVISLVLSGGGSSSVGPNSPGTTTDDATVGTLTWTSPNNAQVSDNTYATVVSSGGSTQTTHYLKATNFGFAIPTAAGIDGMRLDIQRKGTTNGGAGNFVRDSAVRIVKSDGSFGSTNKADTPTVWPFSESYASYGGPTDKWGETWTAININDPNFGGAVSAALTPPDAAQTASIDHMRITVWYTLFGVQGVVSISKGLVKTSSLSVSATAALVLTKILMAAKTLTVSASASVSLSKAVTFLRSLGVTAVAQVSLLAESTLRTIGLTVTASASVVLSKTQSLYKTLAVTAASATSLAKTLYRSFSVSAFAVASLQHVAAFTRALSTSATALASLAKAQAYQRALTAAATGVASLAKARSFTKTLTVSAASSVALALGRLSARILSATAIATPSIARLKTRAINLTVTVVGRVKMLVNGLYSQYSSKYPKQDATYTSKYPKKEASYDKKYP